MSKEVYLYEKLGDGEVQCQNCAHYCVILSQNRGICGVRENQNGKLVALNYGKIVAANIDPIEKKPLFHFLPGTETLSMSSVGCNFRCGNCQNWYISQGFKDAGKIPGQKISPQEIVDMAIRENLPSISYTYTEPTIFSEFAFDTMKIARERGLKNIWVSNGFMSKESAEMIIPYLDANNIDIKSFSEDFYQKNCQGRLQPVLDCAKTMKKSGVWLEMTTLLIPGLSDSEDMLEKIAKFISNELGSETPWHVTRFSGAISWKLKNLPDTSVEKLKKAHEIGKNAGLKYVYVGNIPGTDLENTFCPECSEIVVERQGYEVSRCDRRGKCQKCGAGLNLTIQN